MSLMTVVKDCCLSGVITVAVQGWFVGIFRMNVYIYIIIYIYVGFASKQYHEYYDLM